VALVGAVDGWQYYLSVDEAVFDAARLTGKRLRVSGLVAEGSLAVAEDRRAATFELAGKRHALPIAAVCSLPDNLAEGIDVVVEGTLGADGLRGDKVITRCASKYQSMDKPAR
jgi:cytochrome c-type biogenesis protein CcmE